jgi:phytoene synthase
MNPDDYCQRKAAASGSSFYYSFLFLPAEQRRAILALYAFCREADDVVDDCSDAGVARLKLQWWREEIGRAFQGTPQHPVTQALQPHLQRYNLPEEYFREILDGMEMDLDQQRYPDFSSLALYCYRAAGVVGLLAAEIFGYQDRGTLKYATELGTALQLTNILRDVHEDARRGRIYLPQDELRAAGVGEDDLLRGTGTPQLRQLFARQADRARDYYARAEQLLPEVDRPAQRSGLIMAGIYRTLLDEIEADGFRVLERRVALTPLRKLWIAWKIARREKHRARHST